MGIQLSAHDRHMIGQLAEARRLQMAAYPLLYGYLTAGVTMFLAGTITKERLEETQAMADLLGALYVQCSVAELREIASGARELPGEDVRSGR